MSLAETVIEGTLKPDGTLELDEKPNLRPGRVKVVLRQESEPNAPQPLDVDFFQMMEEIWAGQKARGHVSRTEEELEAERRGTRSACAKRQEAIEQLQEESRRLRNEAERGTESV
jgi:hypothetical protein